MSTPGVDEGDRREREEECYGIKKKNHNFLQIKFINIAIICLQTVEDFRWDSGRGR